MKIRQNISFLLTGWIAGEIAALAFGFFWPVMFPAIIQFHDYTNFGPGLFSVLAILVLLVSPTSLIGGLIGSRVPREGGRSAQFIMAAIFGIILAIPVACLTMWFFTGN